MTVTTKERHSLIRSLQLERKRAERAEGLIVEIINIIPEQMGSYPRQHMRYKRLLERMREVIEHERT